MSSHRRFPSDDPPTDRVVSPIELRSGSGAGGFPGLDWGRYPTLAGDPGAYWPLLGNSGVLLNWTLRIFGKDPMISIGQPRLAFRITY